MSATELAVGFVEALTEWDFDQLPESLQEKFIGVAQEFIEFTNPMRTVDKLSEAPERPHAPAGDVFMRVGSGDVGNTLSNAQTGACEDSFEGESK